MFNFNGGSMGAPRFGRARQLQAMQPTQGPGNEIQGRMGMGMAQQRQMPTQSAPMGNMWGRMQRPAPFQPQPQPAGSGFVQRPVRMMQY